MIGEFTGKDSFGDCPRIRPVHAVNNLAIDSIITNKAQMFNSSWNQNRVLLRLWHVLWQNLSKSQKKNLKKIFSVFPKNEIFRYLSKFYQQAPQKMWGQSWGEYVVWSRTGLNRETMEGYFSVDIIFSKKQIIYGEWGSKKTLRW